MDCLAAGHVTNVSFQHFPVAGTVCDGKLPLHSVSGWLTYAYGNLLAS